MSQTRVLLVDPTDDAAAVASALDRRGCTVTAVDSAAAATTELSGNGFDCVVSEYRLADDDGLSLLRAVRRSRPDLPFVMYTGAGDETVAGEAVEHGVTRYVPKGDEGALDRLVAGVMAVVGRGSEPEPDVPPARDVSEHRPTAEGIVRAIDEAPVGVALADPALPDTSLVYVNDAFERIAGYDAGYVLGRNCRLLQGPETDPETVREMRTAINEERPVTVEVRNYRKDGTPFWNEVTIAPIYDEAGELVHYVGFQNDVSDRKEAQRLARRRAEALSEERAALERVLERIDGLLDDVARVLVEGTDRRRIERRVCEAVLAGGCAAAWIGTYVDSDDGEVRIRAAAGFSEGVERQWETADLPPAVGEALATDRVGHCRVGDDPASELTPGAVGSHRTVVVPLAYGRTSYGLLCVYAADPDALDWRERALFEAIGRMVATGINAVETTRALTTNRVTELRFRIRDGGFALSAVADRLGSPVEYVGLTGGESDRDYLLYVSARDPSKRDPTALAELPFVADVTEIVDAPEEYTVALAVGTPTPFHELAEQGATVTAASAEADRASLVVEAPTGHDHRALVEFLESTYETVAIRSQRERDRRERTHHEFVSAVESRLTDRQRTALETAYLSNYFEWPRSVDGNDLAETMGIARPTFHQHLRSAQRKLLAAFFDDR